MTTAAAKKTPTLATIDQDINRLRQTMGLSDLSDSARYELEELLELRRKLVLGQFQTNTSFITRQTQ
jgi:hypothetical protein